MPEIRSLILATCMLVMGVPAASAAQAEHWITTSKNPCEGLTIGWTPPLAALQKVIGPRWQPAQGPVKGHGILLLFATSCPQSHIGKHASGPFTIGAVIIPVQTPKDTHGIQQSNEHGWAVVPDAFGPASGPVMQLFKRHGFAVTDAKVTLVIHKTAKGSKASMSFVTAQGHIEVCALVSGTAKRFDIISALAGTSGSVFSLFTGPESASRQAQGTAIVTSQGDTWVSRLGLDAKPRIVTLDQGFIWSFRFSEKTY
ncbi:MAG: hypothetical protein ACRESX_04780 [Gammaproteobacteria bacterium]